jgi:phosphoribosyl-ATP pyrophosphohydrolase
MNELLEQLRLLSDTIAARRGGDPETSYTAKLIARGPAQAAKKFGEEAVELAIAAVRGDAGEVAAESADVLYHWLVLLAATGVDAAAVADALRQRQGRSGLDEKAARAQE